jgi:hypothetical protein
MRTGDRRLVHHRALGVEACYRVLAVGPELVELQVVDVPGLPLGARLRVTHAAAAAMRGFGDAAAALRARRAGTPAARAGRASQPIASGIRLTDGDGPPFKTAGRPV